MTLNWKSFSWLSSWIALSKSSLLSKKWPLLSSKMDSTSFSITWLTVQNDYKYFQASITSKSKTVSFKKKAMWGQFSKQTFQNNEGNKILNLQHLMVHGTSRQRKACLHCLSLSFLLISKPNISSQIELHLWHRLDYTEKLVFEDRVSLPSKWRRKIYIQINKLWVHFHSDHSQSLSQH